MKHLIAIASILLMAAGSAFAAGATTPTYLDVCGISSFGSDGALAFIAITFAIVAFGIGLAYMYGKLREDARSETWAKDEAQNLLISVLLFVGLLAFFTASCNIAQSYTGGESPFAASERYISNLENSGQAVLQTLTYTSINDQEAATKYLFTGAMPFYGTGVAPEAGKRATSAHKEIVIDIYLPILASFTAQRYVLEAVQWVGVPLLLPFAFVLRLFPPTREFGNVLIAVFFGIYIVAPVLYAMSGGVFAQITSTSSTSLPAMGNFYSYGLDASTPAAVTDTVLYQIGSAIPQAIFIPNLVLVVTITCIMSMSKGLRALAV